MEKMENSLLKNGQKVATGTVYSALATILAAMTSLLLRKILPDFGDMNMQLIIIYTGLIAGIHSLLKHRYGFPWINLKRKG